MTDVVAERGVGDVTVSQVVARSGVSRRTFYEQFEDREACFLAAFDWGLQRIGYTVVRAYEQPGRWRARIRTALTSLLEAFDRNLTMGRLLVVETLGAGHPTLDRRRHVLAHITAAVDEGRLEARGSDGPPPLTAEGIVGGAFSLVHSRMLDGGDAPITALLNPLMSMIVLPYLGPAAARRELRQPVPEVSNGGGRTGADPLRDLEMRLTYRTIRVLLAIGEHPGASNRRIADAAGIRDQGQISKLLTRLEQLGLIHNAGSPRAKGEPNAWTLTERGAGVRETVSV
jgi:AcrR family transcriptional regulator